MVALLSSVVAACMAGGSMYKYGRRRDRGSEEGRDERRERIAKSIMCGLQIFSCVELMTSLKRHLIHSSTWDLRLNWE